MKNYKLNQILKFHGQDNIRYNLYTIRIIANTNNPDLTYEDEFYSMETYFTFITDIFC